MDTPTHAVHHLHPSYVPVSMYRFTDALPVHLEQQGSGGSVAHLRFDATGVLLAAATGAGIVHVYDYDEVAARVVTMRNARAERSRIDVTRLQPIAPVESVRVGGSVADVRWHPGRDNDVCVVTNGCHSIAYYDLERPAAPVRTLTRAGDAWPEEKGFSSAFTCAAFAVQAPAQEVLLAGDGLGRVRLYDLRAKSGVRWGVAITDAAGGGPAFAIPSAPPPAAAAPVATAGMKRPREEILSARNLNVTFGAPAHAISLAAAAGGKARDDTLHALLSRSIRCVWASTSTVYAVSTGGHMTVGARVPAGSHRLSLTLCARTMQAWDMRKMSIGTMGTRPKPVALWSLHIASAAFNTRGEAVTARVQSALPASYAEGVDALCLTLEDGRTAQVRLSDGAISGMMIPSVPATTAPTGDASITFSAPVNGTAHAHGKAFVPFRATSSVATRLPPEVRTYWMGRRAGELVPPPPLTSTRDQISVADWAMGAPCREGSHRATVTLLSHEQPGLPADAAVTAVAPHPLLEDQVVHGTSTGQLRIHGIWSSE